MADAKVQIGDSENFLEGTTVTTPAGADLFREGVVISDGTDPAARAKITNTSPAADAYGLAVRVVGGVVVGSEVEIKNDSGNPIPVSGSVSVSNFPATQAVSGTVSVSNFPTNNALTDAQLRASPVQVSGTVTVAPTAADTNVTGAWGYAAGTSGAVTLPAGSKVLQISATSTLGGSFTVNGGAAITIPANQQFTLEPRGNLVAPTLVFTSTTAYVVEYVS